MLQADYLIIGSGALGMVFADELLTHSDSTIIMVDKHHMPGGHWNDAYPFVRLHQPSAYYGAGSRVLGQNLIDKTGPNAGCYELASGPEVLAYFDGLMRERFLPSGRVQYLPMSEYTEDGTIVSLLSGARQDVQVNRKIVDGTYFKTSVPSTQPPKYAVADGVKLVTPNALPREAPKYKSFTIIGGGKTGMDVANWLLFHGAPADTIRWIVPRDSWIINRQMTQPGDAHLHQMMKGRADQMEAAATAKSVDELFDRLEQTEQLLRIDPKVKPSMYHGATISPGELAALATIKDVVRLGRVTSITPDSLQLVEGTVTNSRPDELYIDCTASALGFGNTVPVFEGNRITIQMVRAALFSISAAAIAFVEASGVSIEEGNHLCQPIHAPNTDIDWLRLALADLKTLGRWGQNKALRNWQSGHRLTGVNLRSANAGQGDERFDAMRQRMKEFSPAALTNLERLLETVDG